MNQFTRLLKNSRATKNEIQAIGELVKYFKSSVNEDDKIIAFKLLLSITPTRKVTTRKLKEWAAQITKLPPWLIERSVEEAGSFLQAFSLILKSEHIDNTTTLSDWLKKISQIKTHSKTELLEFFDEAAMLPQEERFLVLQLITGTFKSPVPSIFIKKALSDYLKITLLQLSLRLYFLEIDQLKSLDMLKKPIKEEELYLPTIFPIIQAIENDLKDLSSPLIDWNVYGRKEGIPAQLLKYGEAEFLWSEDGEILNHKFPEIIEASAVLPKNLNIQGQILPKDPSESMAPLIGRTQKKSITKKELQENPANFEIWSLSENEFNIKDLSRKTGFEVIEKIDIESLDQLDKIYKDCRKLGYSGILFQNIKKDDSYLYKKATCFSIKAILTYVELDNLNKSGLKSLSFGLVNENQEILPIAKSDCIDKQVDIPEIIDFTKQNTLERFGPVRTVKPELIFELHFESISESRRRKSGLALSNVSVIKKINDASPDRLEYVRELLS